MAERTKSTLYWFWNSRLRFAFLVWAGYTLIHSPISTFEPYHTCGKHHLDGHLSVFFLQQMSGFLAARNIPFYIEDQQIHMTLYNQHRATEIADMYQKYVEDKMFDPSNPDYPSYPEEWIALHEKWKQHNAASLNYFATHGDSNSDLNMAAREALCDLTHAIVTQGKARQEIELPSENVAVEASNPR